MSENVKLLDVVALTEDLPEKDLCRGQVGTVVELYKDEAAEVEFVDNEGQTYALTAVPLGSLLVLIDEPVKA